MYLDGQATVEGGTTDLYGRLEFVGATGSGAARWPPGNSGNPGEQGGGADNCHLLVGGGSPGGAVTRARRRARIPGRQHNAGVTNAGSPESRLGALVVGAGPAGGGCCWLARNGREAASADAETFPRDKPCGDGTHAARDLGTDPTGTVRLGFPGWRATGACGGDGFRRGALPSVAGRVIAEVRGAAPRTLLDSTLRDLALAAGATGVVGSGRRTWIPGSDPCSRSPSAPRMGGESSPSDWWWPTAPDHNWAAA